MNFKKLLRRDDPRNDSSKVKIDLPTRIFEAGDLVEVTEKFRKETLVEGATIKGEVVSSDTDYTEMIDANNLNSHIRTRHLQKLEVDKQVMK